MSDSRNSLRHCNSLLLSLLSDDDFRSLSHYLQPVHTEFRQVITEQDAPIEFVYFPCDSVLSVLSCTSNGAVVGIGTIGNEGLSGFEVLLGGDFASQNMICQVAGINLRMKASDFGQATLGNTPLRRITQRYLQAYLSQVSQSVACNRLHTTEERFARWVLMTHDRVAGDSFHLTQEFLADMLGVHRPGVSMVASEFQHAGLIKYVRGNLTILNRSGLEEAACECYALVRSKFARLWREARG